MNKITKVKVTNVRPKLGNVKFFTGVTRLDFSPDMILSGAMGVLDSVIVLGYDKEGEFFFSGSTRMAGMPYGCWKQQRRNCFL